MERRGGRFEEPLPGCYVSRDYMISESKQWLLNRVNVLLGELTIDIWLCAFERHVDGILLSSL